VGGISRECSIAGIDQDWGRKSCLGAEGRYECVMCEAQHEAGPGRGWSSMALALSKLSLRAKGGLRGAGLRSHFRGSLGEGRCLTPLRLGDARSSLVPSVVTYGDTR